jgi:hypothetical protein
VVCQLALARRLTKAGLFYTILGVYPVVSLDSVDRR